MSLPNQCPGTSVADSLVVALANGNPPAYAVPVKSMPPLPGALDTLSTVIRAQSGKRVSELLLEMVRPEAKLRTVFSFAKQAPSGKEAQQQSVFRNLASGAGDYIFDLPGLKLNSFMAGLFKEIAAGYPQIKLNERDLFHGHIVPNEAGRDLVIVFHAKEWPSEEVPPPKRNMWQQVNLLSAITDFHLDSPEMAQRNFVWTLGSNTLFLLADPNRTTPNSADADFAKLILPGSKQALDAADRKAGTVQESYFGTELLTVNYFPNHLTGGDDGQIFFTPNAGGGWGPVLYLESLFPKVDPKFIRTTYEKTGSSLKQTRDLLSQMKP